MRKSIFFIVLVVLCTYIGVFTTSCSDKKKNTEPTPVDSIATDTTAQDSTDELISEAPLPKAADELFVQIRNFSIKESTFLCHLQREIKLL